MEATAARADATLNKLSGCSRVFDFIAFSTHGTKRAREVPMVVRVYANDRSQAARILAQSAYREA